jgi:hypothetical protein
MQQDGLIEGNRVDLGDGYIEHHTVALISRELKLFSADDLAYVDASIKYYWELTGQEASDDSHGVAWKSRADGDPMPYELALLSDARLRRGQAERLLRLGELSGWAGSTGPLMRPSSFSAAIYSSMRLWNLFSMACIGTHTGSISLRTIG